MDVEVVLGNQEPGSQQNISRKSVICQQDLRGLHCALLSILVAMTSTYQEQEYFFMKTVPYICLSSKIVGGNTRLTSKQHWGVDCCGRYHVTGTL